MTTERQLAANRENAAKSQGPRSRAGIARTARNAYRHGLAASPAPDVLQQVEQLAQEIAGPTAGVLHRERAREAAHAAIDLAPVREVKLAVLNRALATEQREASWSIDPGAKTPGKGRQMPTGDPTSSSPRVLSSDGNATALMADALRRAVPDLVKLDRYESRALARRNRALRALIAGSKVPRKERRKEKDLAERTQFSAMKSMSLDAADPPREAALS